MLIPESCDAVPTGSVSFEIAPVYGHCGVELSGFFADEAYCCGIAIDAGFGNDSERCLSQSGRFDICGVISLKRCLIFLKRVYV